MAESEIVGLPTMRPPMPETIQVPGGDTTSGMTPRELRELKEASGMRLDFLIEEADLDLKMQASVWIMLRRAGHNPTWDEAAEVRPVQGTEPPDPTNAS